MKTWVWKPYLIFSLCLLFGTVAFAAKQPVGDPADYLKQKDVHPGSHMKNQGELDEVLLDVNFNTFPPQGFTMVDHNGNGQFWQRLGLGEVLPYGGQNGYPIEEESPLAYCDSDGAGDVVVDNSLVTNEINIEGYVGVSVAFDMVLRSFDANGTNAYVEVSTDGENWEVAQEWEMTQQEEQYHLYPCEVNLTPFIQGANSIWIRWHYQAHFQYFWAIDNVLVEGIAAGGDPELTITDGLVWPTRLSPGNNVNFTMTISNLGGSDAPPFQVDWFQHLDAPPEIGDTGEQQYMIDGLAAQMSTTIEGTMMMQSVGNYEMYFFVDSQGEVTETNEDNNIPLPIPITVIRDAFYTETFDAFPPAGWTIEDNNMAGLYWNQLAEGGTLPYGGGDGYAIESDAPLAFIDSDAAGDLDIDNSLISANIDISDYSSVSLEFDMVVRSFDDNGTDMWLEVSADDGMTWTVLEEWHMTLTESRDERYPAVYNISEVVGDAPFVKFKFRYAANYQYFWAIDDVTLRGRERTEFIPESPTNLTADLFEESGSVTLLWDYIGDGPETLHNFVVYRNDHIIGTTPSMLYVSQLNGGGYYTYHVIAHTDMGLSLPSNYVTVMWDADNVDDNSAAEIKEFAVSEVYPNPFNPSGHVDVALPQTANIRVSLYNIAGQEVAVIADGLATAGMHTFTIDGSSLASGIYFLKASATGEAVLTQKVILMK